MKKNDLGSMCFGILGTFLVICVLSLELNYSFARCDLSEACSSTGGSKCHGQTSNCGGYACDTGALNGECKDCSCKNAVKVGTLCNCK